MPRFQPLRLLLIAVAGWVHREQAATIAYLMEENARTQGLGIELIAGLPSVGTGDVEVRERIGGMLKHYHGTARRCTGE